MSREELCDDRNPSVAGIIAGISKGGLWLNDKKDPKLAVTYSYCVGGCAVAGDIDALTETELRQFLDCIWKDLRAQKIFDFEFSAEDSKIYERLLPMFTGRQIETEMEFSYRRKNADAGEILVPDGYHIQEIDQTTYEHIINGKFANTEMFTERFFHSWNDTADFFKYSKAFIALWNEQIVGIIFGSASYQDVITIDIEVEEEHRKKGLATALTQSMIVSSARDQKILQWDHVESNHTSAALAKNCGFEPFKQRPYYWFQI